MTKEERALDYTGWDKHSQPELEHRDSYNAFLAGYEAAIRDRDTDLKEAMKQAVKEILEEIRK